MPDLTNTTDNNLVIKGVTDDKITLDDLFDRLEDVLNLFKNKTT